MIPEDDTLLLLRSGRGDGMESDAAGVVGSDLTGAPVTVCTAVAPVSACLDGWPEDTAAGAETAFLPAVRLACMAMINGSSEDV